MKRNALGITTFFVLLEEVYSKVYTKKNPKMSNINDLMMALKGLIAVEPKFALTHLFSTHLLNKFVL
jgi:hypothetical protein